MEKKNTSHISKGLIIAGILIIIDLLLQKWGSHAPQWLQFIPTLILIAGIWVSCMLFTLRSPGALRFGDIFAFGFKTTAVVTCVMAVYTYLAVKFIYPPPTAADIEATVQSIVKQGNTMPDEARKMAMENVSKMWILYVGKVIFATMATGIIGSLLSAALAKKNQ